MTQIENAQISDLNIKMDKILTLLEDSPTSSQKGLITRVIENETKIGKIQTDEKVKRGRMTLLTVIGSGFITLIGWLLK